MINFLTLKEKFREYLLEQQQLESDEQVIVSDVSIFENNSKFEKFLLEEYGIEIDELSYNLSDLKELDFDNGKFVLQNKNTQEPTNDNLTEETTIDTLDLLNGLLEDESVIQYLDMDESNSLDNNEIQTFLDYATMQGKNGQISIEGLFDSLSKAKDGEFKNYVDSLGAEEKKEPEEDNDIDKTDTSSKTERNPKTPSNNNRNLNPTTPDIDKNDDIETLDKDKLEDKKETLEATVTQQKNTLNNLYSSNKEAIETAKQQYELAIQNENLSEELEQKRAQNLSDITIQDETITNLNISIDAHNEKIFSLDNQINQLDENAKAYQNALNSYNDQNDKTSIAKKEELDKLISDTDGQIETLKAQKTASEKQRTEDEKKLQTAKEKLAELESAKSEIDSEILATCSDETKNALNAYNSARENAKTSVTTAKNNLDTSVEALTEVNKQIYANEAKLLENQHSNNRELFGQNNTSTLKMVEDTNGLMYGLISPNDVAPGEKLPVLIFLHGYGERNSLEKLEKVMRDNFMTDLKDFRGYIICPSMKDSGFDNWKYDDSLIAVGKVLDEFSQNHAIDEDKIVMSGHSLGGLGVVHATGNDKFKKLTGYKLKSSIILSGFAAGDFGDFNIPVKSYTGTVGETEQNSLRHMNRRIKPIIAKENFHVLNGVGHGRLDDTAFNIDKNGDGISDLIEWAFKD